MNPYFVAQDCNNLRDSCQLEEKSTLFKRKIVKFRVQELREFLDFVNLDSSGLKPILRNRVMNFLKKEIFHSAQLSERLKQKIDELYELSKIPIKNQFFLFVPSFPDAQKFPMFTELRQLIPGQKFKFEKGTQTMEFLLTSHVIHKIISGRQDDGSFIFEVQLAVWNYKITEKWNDIFLCMEVNSKPLDVHQPSPHIIYLTPFCILKELVYNRVIISSPRPEMLNNYAFGVSLVKRKFPAEVIASYPMKKVSNTALLISQYLNEKVDRRFTLTLACPVTKKVIKHPCRGASCTHPEVFDLVPFLNDMQYYLQWKCPVCMKVINYDDLSMDAYLKKYMREEKTSFVFYKPRPLLTDKIDDEIMCEAEIICISE